MPSKSLSPDREGKRNEALGVVSLVKVLETEDL